MKKTSPKGQECSKECPLSLSLSHCNVKIWERWSRRYGNRLRCCMPVGRVSSSVTLLCQPCDVTWHVFCHAARLPLSPAFSHPRIAPIVAIAQLSLSPLLSCSFFLFFLFSFLRFWDTDAGDAGHVLFAVANFADLIAFFSQF